MVLRAVPLLRRGVAAFWSDGGAAAVYSVCVLAVWRSQTAGGRPVQPLALGGPLAALCLPTLALLAWQAAAPASYRVWRTWAVAAARLSIFCTPPLMRITEALLLPGLSAPGLRGAIVDAIRWILGSRAYTLAYFSYALPLPLAVHLPLQLLSIVVNAVHSEACSLPALENALMAGRIRAFHQLTASSLPLAGCSHPGFPLGSPSVQCAAVLNAARLFFGLLLPTYVVAWQASSKTRRQGGRGTLDPGQPGGGGADSAGGDPAAVRGEFNARLGSGLLDNVFGGDTLLEQQLLVWSILAALCWLLGYVLAVGVATLAP